ncbi:MAG: alpha/beta hydrolase [candidate division KSB1 bacterium]|nr:alpha/beta hydrolase [candidate division KSB1 bacterium]
MASCTRKEAFMNNSRGHHLHYRQWVPDTVKAGILFAHGIGEHSGRYDQVARYFCERDIAFHALDHQGHGQSEGKRGHIPDFKNYVKDLEAFREQVQPILGSAPLFLMGHSMGGLIAFRYLIEHQELIAGAVFSAPSLKIKMQIPAWKNMMALALARVVPSLTVKNGINADLLTHDEMIVDLYRSDPLVHPFISLSLYFDMINTGEYCLQQAHRIRRPVLFMFGGNDEITDMDASRKAFNQINTTDKQFHVLDGEYHEILNELNKTDIFATIFNWIEDRL